MFSETAGKHRIINNGYQVLVADIENIPALIKSLTNEQSCQKCKVTESIIVSEQENIEHAMHLAQVFYKSTFVKLIHIVRKIVCQ